MIYINFKFLSSYFDLYFELGNQNSLCVRHEKDVMFINIDNIYIGMRSFEGSLKTTMRVSS